MSGTFFDSYGVYRFRRGRGFGRTIQTVTGYGSTTVSTVDTQYAPCGCSPLGKLFRQSQPYAPGGSDAWTTYSYDASGRALTKVLPEGSTTTYSYSGSVVGVTSPALTWKQFAMDAFGNLVYVNETDPTLGQVGTQYWYDVLNHLITVSMPRGTSGTQTRTFNYNVGTTVTAFLQSATNPENGTVTYTYNPTSNTLASKTDAKNQTLLYAYDSYNRLTSVTLSPSTVLRTYYYDTTPTSMDSTGTFSQYASGRLTAVQYPAQSGVQMNDMYSYTQAGQPADKRLQVNQPVTYFDENDDRQQTTLTSNLDSTYTYNTEGGITSMSYPGTMSFLVPTPGPTYNYSYDGMYRLSGMTQSTTTIVNNVSYNAANQLLGMSYDGDMSETRGYNVLNQLVTLSSSGLYGAAMENLTYNYPTGANNGKVSSTYNAISGETVTYTYDSLNRLLTANGNGWGESYGFDGFGNLLSKTVTAGSGPGLSQAVNPANNQIVGQSYDANGNANTVYNNGMTYGLNYDAENRLTAATWDGTAYASYAYDAQNRRIWNWSGATDSYGNTTNYTVNVYSPSGQKLGAYVLAPLFVSNSQTEFQVVPSMDVGALSNDTYFGSRRLAVIDQLGSIATTPQGASGTFFPWGEARGTLNPQDNWSYATYWRDSNSGLDYANNRYYSNAYGRFMTPDPSMSSRAPSDPQNWNHYAYTAGDPVNRHDPMGTDFIACDPNSMVDCDPGGPGYCDPSAGPGSCQSDCVGIDGFTPQPGPFCQVDSGPPETTPNPTPSCTAGSNGRDIAYVTNNAASAFGVSMDTGSIVSGAFILAWAAVESGFGTSNVAHQNDNFFGEKDLICAHGANCVPNTNPNHKAPWQGAVPCSQRAGSPNPGFACFTGSTLASSALAALASHGGQYLKVAQANAGGTPGQIAQAIANAGWCTEGNCPNGGYGQQVQADYNELLPIIQCLYPWLLW